MDIKVKGLTYEVLEQALKQAREGRLSILEKMRQALTEPRPHLSPYAPKVFRMVIPVDKIGALIGPGGRNIRAIQEETGVTIDTEDDGTVIVGSSDDAMIQRARERIEGLTREIVVGEIFTGKVKRLTSFGAFVELLPGKEGLVRQGELGDVGDGLKVGQEITVIVHEIDSLGRINLSRRALFSGEESSEGAVSGPTRPPSDQPPRHDGPSLGSGGSGQQSDRRPFPGQGGSRPSSGPGRRPPPPRRTFRGPSDR
jgi:polyribonucleotide nucleotidyltransferase